MPGSRRPGATSGTRRTSAGGRSRRALTAVATAGVAVAVACTATPWTFGQALRNAGPAYDVQQPLAQPKQSPVEETAHPARYPRQVRESSNSSVAPSDTSSVDPVTDDAAVGMVSSTGDDNHLPSAPAELDPVTGLVGLDSHDHPWDERPPPIVDLGDLAENVPAPHRADTT